MPETVETQQTVPNTPQLPVEAPNQASRVEVYEKIYGGTQAPEPQPQVQQPAAPQGVMVDPAALQALITEVAQLKERVNQPAPAPVIAEPAPPPKDWFNLLQDGRRTEAETALKDAVVSQAKDSITQDAVRQAYEIFNANQEINNYNNFVRTNNPDLLDVEHLVALQAEQYFREGQTSVKSTKDFTELYKQSVNKAVESLRTTLQRTRAVAKQEERTTRQEVLNSYTMQPNQITSVQRETRAANQPEVPDTSAESYIRMRQGNYQTNQITPDIRRQMNAAR